MFVGVLLVEEVSRGAVSSRTVSLFTETEVVWMVSSKIKDISVRWRRLSASVFSAGVLVLTYGLSACEGTIGTNEGAGGGSAGSGGQTCTPQTCASLGANCGNTPDGCGQVLSCGTCEMGTTCGAAGPNQCGAGTCTPTTCSLVGAECGMIADGCGETLNCGGCQTGQTCGVEKPNQCGGSGTGGTGGSGTGGTGGTGGAGGGPASVLFSMSFEAAQAGQHCQNEHPNFTTWTDGNCDATGVASHGQQSASLDVAAGQRMLALHGAFSASTGQVWLSYDLRAPAQPTFTIMMDAWAQGMNSQSPDNPWDNRNPFSLEWRDGWFAMNCNYPNDHGTERRSPQVNSPLGVGQWVNVVIRYDLDTEQGAFWLRGLNASGQPTSAINQGSPTGTVNCAALGNRGAFGGLAVTNFQSPNGAVVVHTDRWILGDDISDMP